MDNDWPVDGRFYPAQHGTQFRCSCENATITNTTVSSAIAARLCNYNRAIMAPEIVKEGEDIMKNTPGLSIRIDEDTELRLYEERHAQEVAELVDQNRAYLRQWLPCN
jgi:hypothetical protein